jgi:hypothetical protein
VLGQEVEINPYPPPLKILSVGDPSPIGTACKHVCPGAHTCTPVFASESARNPGMYEPHISPHRDKGKHTAKATPALIWDDVARKG